MAIRPEKKNPLIIHAQPVAISGRGIDKHSELPDLDISGHPADIIAYDNSVSGLLATKVQDAIDELAAIPLPINTHAGLPDLGTSGHPAIHPPINHTHDHTLLTNIGTNSHSDIDSHIVDGTIHFTEASIDHDNIQNIGSNDHAQIDTHLAAASPHSGHVDTTGDETIAGIKTFSSFPITPSSAPTTDYQVANKKYVDGMAIINTTLTGFVNRTSSILSFVDLTRIFTITPVGSFDFYNQGVKYTKSIIESVVIANTQGKWYIYYNSSGVLMATQSTINIKTQTYVAGIYWNATEGWGVVTDERHGIIMDTSTHRHLHNAFGCQYYNGLIASGYTLNEGSNDSSVQIGLTDGKIADEDIVIDIKHAAVPANPFEQYLIHPAQIPVWYLTGVGIWTKDLATNYCFKNTPGGRVNYNQLVGGIWQQTEVSAGNFVAYYIIATNKPTNPIISIQGQRWDGTFVLSQENNLWYNMLLYDLPIVEMRALYRIIIQTGAYTNTRKAKIREVLTVNKDLSYKVDSIIESGD